MSFFFKKVSLQKYLNKALIKLSFTLGLYPTASYYVTTSQKFQKPTTGAHHPAGTSVITLQLMKVKVKFPPLITFPIITDQSHSNEV